MSTNGAKKLGYLATTARELGILLKKQFIQAKRNGRSAVFQIVAPMLADALNKEVPNPPTFDIGQIPSCVAGTAGYCFTMLYAPRTATNDAVVQYMCDHRHGAALSLGYDPNNRDFDVIGFDTADEMRTWTIEHPNITLAAFKFFERAEYLDAYNLTQANVFKNHSADSIIYQMWFNQSLVDDGYDVRLEYTRSLHEAILAVVGGDNIFDFDLEHKIYPEVKSAFAQGDQRNFSPIFFYSAIMFSFIHLMTQMVAEKEYKLVEGLRVMGMVNMRDHVQSLWLSWVIVGTIMAFVAVNMVIGTGFLLDYKIFTNCNYFVNLFNLGSFSFSMIAVANLLSALISRSKTANTVAFFVFVIGFLFLFILSSFVTVLYQLPDNWVTVFFFFPPFNFAKIMKDISALADTRMTNDGTVEGPGYEYHHLFGGDYQNSMTLTPPYEVVVIPPTITNIYYQLMDFCIYAVLAWYIENVFPGEYGTPKPLYFFLLPSYWGFHSDKQQPIVESFEVDADEDVDVNEERRKVIFNLTKRFGSGVLRRKYFTAVKNLCVSMEKGQLFCLLGHNGAGKTTAINMMTGMFGPSWGEAYICGYSMTREMEEIRNIMGVCPQHDILWQELTPREHCEIFATIKGIPLDKLEDIIHTKLDEVHLLNVQNERVSSLSGGMKRRLSVALSTIGDPKIIFMDEPTTGMDPVSRRKVWELISSMKKDRVVILTTHSMEEADVLGDRIAIMSHGQLKAIGSSLRLKSRYGSGYRLSITCAVKNIDAVKALVNKSFPKAIIEAESAGSLVFSLPQDQIDDIPSFFSVLEKEAAAEGIIGDFGVSNTTLEECFLKVTGLFKGN